MVLRPWTLTKDGLGVRSIKLAEMCFASGVNWGSKMTGYLYRVLFIVVMIAIIVSVDILFLRHHFTARLVVNMGIVAVFVIAYFISFKK